MRKFWTDVDDAQLRELYPHLRSDVVAQILGRTKPATYGRAKNLGLSKSAEYLASPEACRLRRGDNVGAPYRFKKGQIPQNKVKRMPGWAPGRMATTQFKKGQSNHNAVPVGSTRIVDGYLYLKVAEVRYVPYTVNWLPVHILNWERANGRPLPAGHCLFFKDGNRQNVEISNLELITRRDNMLRNTLHRLPKPLKRAIYAKGALNRRINRMVKERAEQHA